MAAQIGDYVRATFKFPRKEVSDLSLSVGDIFRVTDVVDENMVAGKKIGLDSVTGVFSMDCVEHLTLPNVLAGQKVFLVIEDFPKQQTEDLELKKGDIILGIEPVDDMWWTGKNGTLTGIFPLTFVVEFERDDLTSSTLSHDLKPGSNGGKSQSDRGCMEAVNSRFRKVTEGTLARALRNVTARLDGELTFQQGDLIEIADIIDDCWYYGRSGSKEGILSAASVEILNDDSGWKGICPSFDSKNQVQLKTVNERIISYHEPKDATSRPKNAANESYSSETTHLQDVDVTPFGRVLYPFTSQDASELSLSESTIVVLIRHVDQDWTEGEVDEKRGIFPTSFIEIIVDCPYDYSHEMKGNQPPSTLSSGEGSAQMNVTGLDNKAVAASAPIRNKESGRESWTTSKTSPLPLSDKKHISMSNIAGANRLKEVPGGYQIGLVLYSFMAKDLGDVSVSKGDTVEVIKSLDENWLEVTTEDGRVGHIPSNYVEVIKTGSEEQLESFKYSSSSSSPNTIVKHLKEEAIALENNVTDNSLSICSPDRNFSVQCSASKTNNNTNNNNGVKTSALSTTRNIVPVIKPSITPKVKPPILPKPSLSSKPVIATKSTPGIRPKFFPLTNPVSKPKSTVKQQDSLTLENKSCCVLDTTIDKKVSEDKNMCSHGAYCIQGDSECPPLTPSDSSLENYNAHFSSNTNNYPMSYRKTEANVTSDFITQSSNEFKSGSKTSSKTSSNVNLINMESEQEGSSVRKDKLTSSLSYSEDSISKPSAVNRRKSTSFAEQKIHDALKLSAQSLMVVNKSFAVDVANNTITNLSTDTTHVSFHHPHPVRPVPAKPTKPSPRASAEASALPTRLKGPPPSPKSGISQSNSVLSTLTMAESSDKPVPRRPPPKVQNNHSQDLSTSVKHMSSYIAKPPHRIPPRPTSFPSAPRRPPPRPADLQFVSLTMSRTEGIILELVADLKRKLEVNQADIKKYEQIRSELQWSLSQADSQTKEAETKSSLEFVESQLDDLRAQERRLTENLFTAGSHEAKLEKSRLLVAQNAAEDEKRKDEEEARKEEEEARKEEERKRTIVVKEKKKNQRARVIEEIIHTEKDYLFSLHLCLETFYDGQKPPLAVDLGFLLGNMEEIADVSQKMLISLETCVSGKSLEEQCLGECFINFADDMKSTYAPYCRNHDEVIAGMEQFVDSTEISHYFNSKIEKMKKQTNVFDMASILIKPVQRILKYPLLLNELLKSTEEGHPDKPFIEIAIKEMTDVARAINEYKRRKDLVYKYKKLTDQTFSDKISKLNLHSIKKKSTRIKGRLSTNFGIALQLRDEMFEKEEAKFHHMDRTVKVFLGTIQQYLEQSQDAIRCQTGYVDDIKDFYQGKECPEAMKLYDVTGKQLSLFDNMKATVENDVVVPLNVLVGLFSAPAQVIEKRFDKMLDYNYQLGKTENDKELQTAKNDYEAMNAQLLDELPKFYYLAFKMLRHCISVFVLARRDFMDQSLRESCALLELATMASKANLIDTFKIRHTTAFDHMSMLSFIPKGFNTRVDTVKADRAMQKGPVTTQDGSLKRQNSFQASSGSQNESRRRYLLQLYPPDKLYAVTSTYNAVDLMDISVTEGSLVGVVKEVDPMGNQERWFVDDGGSKGFVPFSILTPVESSLQDTVSNADEDDDIISILSGDCGDIELSGNDDRVECHTNNSFTDSFSRQPQVPQYQYYYALYDFKARHPNETSLTAGHPVTVVAFHDLDGNSEWWLVDSEGKRGYAPANYMSPVSYS